MAKKREAAVESTEKKVLFVKIDKSLHDKIAALAAKDRRAISAMAHLMLHDRMAELEAKS